MSLNGRSPEWDAAKLDHVAYEMQQKILEAIDVGEYTPDFYQHADGRAIYRAIDLVGEAYETLQELRDYRVPLEYERAERETAMFCKGLLGRLTPAQLAGLREAIQDGTERHKAWWQESGREPMPVEYDMTAMERTFADERTDWPNPLLVVQPVGRTEAQS